jgi:hypothetical protein
MPIRRGQQYNYLTKSLISRNISLGVEGVKGLEPDGIKKEGFKSVGIVEKNG